MSPHEKLLKAVHAAFGNEQITTRAINARLTGLALKDPANAALLQAIVGCIGRKIHSTGIGRLLEKVRGRRIGDLELVCDGEKRNGFWRYYMKDHSAPIAPEMPPPDLEQIQKEAETNSHAWVDKVCALPPSKKIPAIQAQLNRHERAKREAVEVSPPPDVPGMIKVPAPYAPDAMGVYRAQGWIEVSAPPPNPATTWQPGCGRQPTRAELAARHSQSEGPSFDPKHSSEWFMRACAARNAR